MYIALEKTIFSEKGRVDPIIYSKIVNIQIVIMSHDIMFIRLVVLVFLLRPRAALSFQKVPRSLLDG